ncbi:serine protease [Macrococcoides goetzii]|nr:serine protease [Macrococcus goetzii]
MEEIMQHKHKIVIKKKNYSRPKRLFFKGQKVRMIYPYLHKKDNILEKIASKEDIEIVDDTITKSDKDNHINENKESLINSNSIATEEAIDKENTVDVTKHIENEVSPETNDSQKHENNINKTSEENELVEESFSRNEINDDLKNSKGNHSFGSQLPKILMGTLAGILIGILLMSLFNSKPQEVSKQSEVKTSTEQAIKKNIKNVVSITNLQKATDSETIDPESAVKAPEEVGIGTGIIYKTEKNLAYILTNYHVVGKANEIEVTYEGKKEKAKMIGYDVWTDMAILTMPKGNINSVIEMTNSNDLEPGQEVIALGSPLGQMFAGSASSGIISGLSRNVPVDIDGDEIYDWEMNVLQTDAAINPGNSGGPLLNKEGKMIGLNSMKISMEGVEGIAFSIPVNEVKKVLKELEQKGSINRPKMGIMIEDVGTHSNPNDPNSPTDQTGVEIMEIEPNALAEKNGLMLGDIIKKIDNKEIKSKIHFRKILFNEKKIGDTITLTIIRNGAEKNIKIKL